MTTMTLLRVVGTNVLLRSLTSKTSSVIVTDHTTRKHSIRMRTARLQTVRASVATTRCRIGGGLGRSFLKWIKFKQVSSIGHQMSAARGRQISCVGLWMSITWALQVWCPHLIFPGGGGYPITWPIPWWIWCYLSPPLGQTDACKTLPFRNFVCERNECPRSEIDTWRKEIESALSQCTKWTTR